MSVFLLAICLLGGSFLQVFSQDKGLCDNENGGCKHFCHVVGGNVVCACADGYFLAQDNQSCNSNETFRCGAIVTDVQGQNRTEKRSFTEEQHEEQRNSSSQISSDREAQTGTINGQDCPPGHCPWQALLINEDNIGFCGGTILTEYIILTAAHCMNQSRYFIVKLGEHNTTQQTSWEMSHEVDVIISHFKYNPETHNNDIALVRLSKPIRFNKYILPACIPQPDFAENVLMRQRDGLVSGFGRLGEGRETSTILQRLSVPYVDRLTCIESTQLRISMRMFCAGYDTIAKDACQGDSGGPHVTRYHDTYFITGIVSWGEGCARKGKYGVYTQVSKYIHWIREGIKKLTPRVENRQRRDHGAIKRLYL